MHIELPITLHDLKVIMRNIAGTRQSVNIKWRHAEVMESCIISQYDAEFDLVSIVQHHDHQTNVIEISVLNVEFIEFESFYAYKGLYSKTFVVQ